MYIHTYMYIYYRAGATGATGAAMVAPFFGRKKWRNVKVYIRTIPGQWDSSPGNIVAVNAVLAVYSMLMKGGVVF